MFTLYLDWVGPLSTGDLSTPNEIIVPDIECPLNENDYSELQETIEILSPSRIDYVNNWNNICYKSVTFYTRI